MIPLDPRVQAQLKRVAAHHHGDVDSVLRRLLRLDEFSIRSRYFANAPEPFLSMLDHLDTELCVRNPGLHYVSRATYVGYRREESARRTTGARSQVFLSVPSSTRRGLLQVLLPLDPKKYALAENMRDVSAIGHHGIGDLEVTIRTKSDIDDLFNTFGDWLTDNAS